MCQGRLSYVKVINLMWRADRALQHVVEGLGRAVLRLELRESEPEALRRGMITIIIKLIISMTITIAIRTKSNNIGDACFALLPFARRSQRPSGGDTCSRTGFTVTSTTYVSRSRKTSTFSGCASLLVLVYNSRLARVIPAQGPC